MAQIVEVEEEYALYFHEEDNEEKVEITVKEETVDLFAPIPEEHSIDSPISIVNTKEELPISKAMGKKRASIGEAMGQDKKKKRQFLKCTACSPTKQQRNLAEICHPILHVPLCGTCHANYRQRDTLVIEKNESSCIWCGLGDGNNLLMCDTCVFAFCSNCIHRNFGPRELKHVEGLKEWSCYSCTMPDSFTKLQVDDALEYSSLYQAYASIRPPTESVLPSQARMEALIAKLSRGEQMFASIFSDEVMNGLSSKDLNMPSFLKAKDIFAVIYRLSKPLRNFFQAKIHTMPGLFQTAYGQEFQCRLYPHQIVSLHAMLAIEMRNKEEFGALRGGIFGDEPGLGKTVTALALIASTAGSMPYKPRQFWNTESIEERWRYSAADQDRMVSPLLNKMHKSLRSFLATDPEPFLKLKEQVGLGKFRESLSSFVDAAQHCISSLPLATHVKEQLHYILQNEMSKIQAGLDISQRRQSTSTGVLESSSWKARLKVERGLWSSAATLIVVPLALLEHWYEQIMRHLNLEYFCYDDTDCIQDGDKATSLRGIVYLDGLGDIMDVEAPISRLYGQSTSMKIPIEELATYTIVVTTLERCISEQSLTQANVRWSEATTSPLHQIRWLRLLVDEGHELGRDVSTRNASAKESNSAISVKNLVLATDFIANIAAERRWIMSGTPTTSANSDEGLKELFRLMVFLRHPTYTMKYENMYDNEELWRKQIIKPCMMQDRSSWEEIVVLLKSIMVRHLKSDIKLYDPIFSNVPLLSLPDREVSDLPANGNLTFLQAPGNNNGNGTHAHNLVTHTVTTNVNLMNEAEQLRMVADDRAKANYIRETILQAWKDYKKAEKTLRGGASSSSARQGSPQRRSFGGVPLSNTSAISALQEKEQELIFKSRPPKAIVFSQHDNDLQGVGHFLYLMMGESAICEHYGLYQSSELSRFRHSKRKFRTCPLCGHRNNITNEKACDKFLIMVEYLDVDEPAATDVFEASPGGHGANGPGSYFKGLCLCSEEGCPAWTPSCYPNTFQSKAIRGIDPAVNRKNLAIVAEDHIAGYVPGLRYQPGQIVHILRADKSVVVEDNNQSGNPKGPILWSHGRLGGRAVVRVIQRCGGNGTFNSWHGGHILSRVPWTVESEDTMVMLLQQEGSTGLDLSFATHIFLLERIQNPGLRNQIISRAHRVGATGPVLVQLLLVVAEEEESIYKAELLKKKQREQAGSSSSSSSNRIVVAIDV